jgi:hypothetical protein
MVSVSQIRDLVSDYVGEQIDLKQFSQRFESLYGDVVAADNADVLAYADCIASFLARVRAGYSHEFDLRVWLEPIANDPSLPVCNGYRDVSSSLPYSGELLPSRLRRFFSSGGQ